MTDLRISVTDRCNFRCTFCMPGDRAYTFLPRPQILTFEEVSRLARLMAGLGVRKIRLTGGEPLLRADIDRLVEQLAAIDGVDDLAMTTNGSLLPRYATAVRRAGLRRVTVSVHSLDETIFSRLAGRGLALEHVLAGLEAAHAAGMGPIKINTVAMKGVNDHEVEALAAFGRARGYVVRFIEYMDVGTVNRWDPGAVVSAREIVERIDARWPLEPVGRDHPGDVAERYRYRDGAGEIGVIPSITQPFCGTCSRVRLSAEGRLYTCLFGRVGHDLKAPLRAGEDDETLAARLRAIWRGRVDRYSEQRTAALQAGTFVAADKVEMFRIGG